MICSSSLLLLDSFADQLNSLVGRGIQDTNGREVTSLYAKPVGWNSESSLYLPIVRSLELGDLQGPFHPKPSCFYFDRETDVLHIPCSLGNLGKCSIFLCLGLRVGIWTSPYLKIKSNKCSAIIKTRLSVGIMLSERWFHAQTPHQYTDILFPLYVWSLNSSVANKVVLNVNGGSLELMCWVFFVSLFESRAVL